MFNSGLHKGCPNLQIMQFFFNIVQNAFVSILCKFYANLMSILCQNAFTESVFFKHGFDPPVIILPNILFRAIGIMVYVFNCSEQMDYKSCGNIFKAGILSLLLQIFWEIGCPFPPPPGPGVDLRRRVVGLWPTG